METGYYLGGQLSRLCAGGTGTPPETVTKLRFVEGSLEALVKIVDSYLFAG
jgi:hypothetical protein